MWYTGKGDAGETSLRDGVRVAKDDVRLEALGDLDEATSAIGLARAQAARPASKPLLTSVQRVLVLLMAEVASPEPERLSARVGAAEVIALEGAIHALEAEVPRFQVFILPGDSPGAAALDLARAVVRRAERHLVTLVRREDVRNFEVLRYLNRLSSLLYLLARADDAAAGIVAPTRA